MHSNNNNNDDDVEVLDKIRFFFRILIEEEKNRIPLLIERV